MKKEKIVKTLEAATFALKIINLYMSVKGLILLAVKGYKKGWEKIDFLFLSALLAIGAESAVKIWDDIDEYGNKEDIPEIAEAAEE